MERHSLHQGEPHSRRAAIGLGGALLAAAGALSLPCSGATSAQSSPVAGAGAGLLVLQAFSKGTLFPTQGDAGQIPYTVILWDAADRGVFYTTAGGAGIAPTESLVIAIEAGEQPLAAIVSPGPAEGDAPRVFALRLGYAGLGSDPGAITYQGEPVSDAEITAWLGVAPTALSDGPVDLATGYLLIAGVPGLDLPEGGAIQIATAE